MKAHQLPTNAIVVNRSDVERIKTRSVVKSVDDEMREKEARDAERAEKQKTAKMRKERMIQLEEDAKKKAQKSELEVEKAARAEAIKQMGEKEINGNLDLVKHLNALGARASAFTIRDQQLAFKQRREQGEKEYELRMDHTMEIDRYQDLMRRENDEAHRYKKRIEDRQVIIEQIATREKQKLMAEEAREQENQAMRDLTAKYKADDVAAARAKQEQINKVKMEVFHANEKAIARKEIAKQRDKEEEAAILQYVAQKDAEMRRREEEEAEKARIMKERQAKLLAMQEKTQNKQAEIDELRAVRYAEERERKERTREKNEKSDKERREMSMARARVEQAEQKRAMAAREGAMQQQEIEDALTHAVKSMERDRQHLEGHKKLSMTNKDLLKQQIDVNDFAAKRNKGRKYDEGRKVKDEFAAERAKLEAIRDKMVHDMEKKGINPRYLTEMKMADIQKMQMR